MNILKQLFPYEYVESVFAINYTNLYNLGFRALIFDIDNTLVHHGDNSTNEIDNLFKRLYSIGFKTLLLSNNSEERIKRFNVNIGSPYIFDADKPNPSCFIKAVEMLGVDKKEAIVIGDQIFTDILGANRSGIASILVKFIQLDNETKIGKRRQLEKMILRIYSLFNSQKHRLGDVVLQERN